MNMMKRKLLLIGVSVSMLIGAVSVAASSGVELHEFFNAKGERVMYPYPLGTFKGPQNQVSIGQIIETEDGKERVIAVDGQGSYVTEVLDQEGK